MKKIIASIILSTGLTANALSPNEMLTIVGAVKYYNENCEGLTSSGVNKMNQGLERFSMDQTPLSVLEEHQFAVSGYNIATKFGCKGTKEEAVKAGYGAYIN